MVSSQEPSVLVPNTQTENEVGYKNLDLLTQNPLELAKHIATEETADECVIIRELN